VCSCYAGRAIFLKAKNQWFNFSLGNLRSGPVLFFPFDQKRCDHCNLICLQYIFDCMICECDSSVRIVIEIGTLDFINVSYKTRFTLPNLIFLQPNLAREFRCCLASQFLLSIVEQTLFCPFLNRRSSHRLLLLLLFSF